MQLETELQQGGWRKYFSLEAKKSKIKFPADLAIVIFILWAKKLDNAFFVFFFLQTNCVEQEQYIENQGFIWY